MSRHLATPVLALALLAGGCAALEGPQGIVRKTSEDLAECVRRGWAYDARIRYEPHRKKESFGQNFLLSSECEDPGSLPEPPSAE